MTQAVKLVGLNAYDGEISEVTTPKRGKLGKVVLIDDDEIVNAWALPGGKMAVYTGILPYTLDADGLAAVMGHEAAHASARHGGENMTRQGLVGILAIGAAAALDSEDHSIVAAAATAARAHAGSSPVSRNRSVSSRTSARAASASSRNRVASTKLVARRLAASSHLAPRISAFV